MATRIEEAKLLLNSPRGEYLIGQALVRAMEAMRQDEHPEESNIQDMELLVELFPFYRAASEATDAFYEAMGARKQ